METVVALVGALATFEIADELLGISSPMVGRPDLA
jgi:hypothetical protein